MNEVTPIQKQVLDLFSKSELKNIFYWTGGTLLSVVYLHHRLSQDIDFFSDEPFSYEQVSGFIKELKEKLKLEFVEKKKIFDRWEFFLHNGKELRLEFVYYNHPKLNDRILNDGILVDSFDDIAANKVMALLDRNEPKDTVDMYFLLHNGQYSPDKLLKLVEKKFGFKVQESLLWSEILKGLEDLDNLEPLLLTEDRKEAIRKIKQYFKDQSRNFLNKNLE